jgi:hypothetical protein
MFVIRQVRTWNRTSLFLVSSPPKIVPNSLVMLKASNKVQSIKDDRGLTKVRRCSGSYKSAAVQGSFAAAPRVFHKPASSVCDRNNQRKTQVFVFLPCLYNATVLGKCCEILLLHASIQYLLRSLFLRRTAMKAVLLGRKRDRRGRG